MFYSEAGKNYKSFFHKEAFQVPCLVELIKTFR